MSVGPCVISGFSPRHRKGNKSINIYYLHPTHVVLPTVDVAVTIPLLVVNVNDKYVTTLDYKA